jgi:TolB-like protein
VVALVTPPSSEVAILPFVHESDSELSMFLAMGIPSAVAERVVGAIPDLPVLRPRRNRPTTDDANAMKDMGSQLGARFIVSGTVSESRRGARVSVSLYDAKTANRRWTKEFAYDSATSLSIVQTIATEVASRIATPLTAKQGELLAESPTKSGGAFEWYIRGNAAFAGDAFERAADAYRNALRRDRSFANAYAKLALVDAAMMSEGIEKSTDGTVLKNELRAAATMSITSDRNSALSWSAEARARILEGRASSQWRDAYDHALSLSGKDPSILEAYGLALLSIDERDAAKVILKRASQAAPWRAEVMTGLANLAMSEGNDLEACNLLNTAIATDALFGPAWSERALLRSRHDELRFAWADAETAVKLGSIMLGESAAAMIDLKSRDTTRARERLAELWLDVQTRGSLGLSDGKAVAAAFAAAGQTAKAIDVLELVRPRVNLFGSMLRDPKLERLRREPRFRALMAPPPTSNGGAPDERSRKDAALRPPPNEVHQFVAGFPLGQSVQR